MNLYSKRSVLLIVQKLFEHYFWQNGLKLYNKIDLSIRMKILYSVKNRYAFRLKFGDKLLTSVPRLVLPVKISICSIIK